MHLILALLIIFNLQTNTCPTIVDGPILDQQADWDAVNYAGNDVIDNFPIEGGYIAVLKSNHILVFDHNPQDTPEGDGYHPCGVYAMGEIDLVILKETYTPQYNSWQEYWLATHEPRH